MKDIFGKIQVPVRIADAKFATTPVIGLEWATNVTDIHLFSS